MWMRWRHKFSSGREAWRWADLGATKDPQDATTAAEDFCTDMRTEYAWSEQYRGIDYELAERPPVEVLRELASTAEGNALRWAARGAELRALLADEERLTAAAASSA